MSDSPTTEAARGPSPSASPASSSKGVAALLAHWFGMSGPAREWWSVAAVVVAAPLVMAPLMVRLIAEPSFQHMDTNDFEFHVNLAVRETSFLPLSVPAPHPLFHLAVRALEPLVGGGLASLTVMSVSISATMLVVVAIGRHPLDGSAGLSPAWAAGLASVWLLAESPTALVQLVTGSEAPYAIIHFWGSPTEVVFIPLAFLLTLVVGDVLRNPARYVGRAPAALVVVLVILTALAKPSMGLVLAPASVALVVISRRWRDSTGPLLRVFVIPAIVVAVAQTAFLVWGPMPTGTSGFAIAPFEVAGQVVRAGGAAFWLLLVALAVLAVVLWTRLRSDVCVQLSALSLLIALGPMLLLKETGPRAADAALLKLGFAAAAVLTVFLFRAALVDLRDRWQRSRRERGVGWQAVLVAGTLALFVVSGLAYYVELMLQSTVPA